MAGSNQVPHGVPYGDIFSADTPVTDSTVSRLQAEERQRQQFQQQQDKNLDGIMDREFTKVRSVDTPEVLDAWNRYKSLSKRTLFDKSLQNNPKEYNSVNQDKNAALADVYSKINASNDLQQRDKELIQSQRMH